MGTVDEEITNFVHVLALCSYISPDSIELMENGIRKLIELVVED